LNTLYKILFSLYKMALVFEKLSLQFITDNALENRMVQFTTSNGKVFNIMFTTTDQEVNILVLDPVAQAQKQKQSKTPPQPSIVTPMPGPFHAEPMPYVQKDQSGGSGSPSAPFLTPPKQQVVPKANPSVQFAPKAIPSVQGAPKAIPSVQFALPPQTNGNGQQASAKAPAAAASNAQKPQHPMFKIEQNAQGKWEIFKGENKLTGDNFQEYSPTEQDLKQLKSFYGKKAASITVYGRTDTSDYYMKFGNVWYKYIEA
jgi:hypothetical protein